MIIRKAYLKNFGKFNDKTVEFKDGLNIIYGVNEAGKSTIQKFIEGMFFGYFKPFLKTKKYTTDYDKYLPWQYSSEYAGVLECQIDDKYYRIERNFLKQTDEVKIYDVVTGEDITNLAEYNSVIKMAEPASIFLGISKVTYTNTISISQLKSKTEQELSGEIKDYIANLGSAKKEDISVDNIIKILDERIELIGTERRAQSPLGKIIENIKQLNDELDECKRNKETLDEKLEVLENFKKEQHNNQHEIKETEKEYFYIIQKELINKYSKANNLIGEMHQIEELMRPLEIYKNIDEDNIQNVITISNQIEILEEQVLNLEREMKIISNELHKVEYQINEIGLINKEKIEEIYLERDYDLYKELYYRKEKLIKMVDSIKQKNNDISIDDIDIILSDYEKYERLEDNYNIIVEKFKNNNLVELNEKTQDIGQVMFKYNIACMIITVIAILFLFIKLYITIGLLGLTIFLLFKSKKYKDSTLEIDNEFQNYKSLQEEYEEEIIIIRNKQNGYLKKNNIKNYNEFKILRDKVFQMKINQKEYFNAISEKNTEIKEIEKKLQKLSKSIINTIRDFGYQLEQLNDELIKDLSSKIRNVRELIEEMNYLRKQYKQVRNKYEEGNKRIEYLRKTKESTLESYDINSDKKKDATIIRKSKQQLIQLDNDYRSKKILLQQLLGEYSLDELESLIKVNNEEVEYVNIQDKERYQSKLKELQEEIVNITRNIGLMESEIAQLYNKTRQQGDIETDISDNKKMKEELEKKIKIYKLAKETLLKISKKIHRDFAPQLNEEVNNIVKNITNDKYKDIKISEEMSIVVKDDKNNKYVPLEQLSYGTMDQMYFSLRLGLIKFVKGQEKYPIILDDAFTQYDDTRLLNVLKWLSKQKDKQILIFTCHMREKNLLDKENIEHNYIELER